MKSWFLHITQTRIEFDVNDVLFGISNDSKNEVIDFMNYCILYGKWYIYTVKKMVQNYYS